MTNLPPLLSHLIAEELQILTWKDIQKACAESTKAYHSHKGLPETLSHHLAYLATRLPATYHVLAQILESVRDHLGALHSAIDLGAGPGTAAWALKQTTNVQQLVCVEKNTLFISLGKKLTAPLDSGFVVQWIPADLYSLPALAPGDLVILSYVLNEIASPFQETLIKTAASLAKKALLLVEPGTPEGAKRVLKARNILMKEGFFTQSPCPHNQPCPLATGGKTGKDWCHFSARLSRTVLHRYAKKGSLMWENEPFSYIVMTRTKAPETKPRVLKHPRQRKGQVILDLCTPEGTQNTAIITKKNPTLYSHAQNIKWGDPFPSQEER